MDPAVRADSKSLDSINIFYLQQTQQSLLYCLYIQYPENLMLQRTLTLAEGSRTSAFNRELRKIQNNTQPCAGIRRDHKFIALRDLADPHETIICRLTRKHPSLGIGVGDLVFVSRTNTCFPASHKTYAVKNNEGELYLVPGQLLDPDVHDVLGSLTLSCPGGKSLRYSPKVRVFGRYRQRVC